MLGNLGPDPLLPCYREELEVWALVLYMVSSGNVRMPDSRCSLSARSMDLL